MADKTPFVINDRRKFTAEGELRHDLETPATPQEPSADATQPGSSEDGPASHSGNAPIAFPSKTGPGRSEDGLETPHGTTPIEFPAHSNARNEETEEEAGGEDALPPAPTSEQSERATRAYDATVDRLDTAIRATNPGMERMPEMTFEGFVQSLYMQAILQLGGAAKPGQTPQVDLLGARQSIDMLAIIADKTKGNLTPPEDKLLQSALFELRMGFLEITQALARQAAKQPGGPQGGPSIVR